MYVCVNRWADNFHTRFRNILESNNSSYYRTVYQNVPVCCTNIMEQGVLPPGSIYIYIQWRSKVPKSGGGGGGGGTQTRDLCTFGKEPI